MSCFTGFSPTLRTDFISCFYLFLPPRMTRLAARGWHRLFHLMYSPAPIPNGRGLKREAEEGHNSRNEGSTTLPTLDAKGHEARDRRGGASTSMRLLYPAAVWMGWVVRVAPLSLMRFLGNRSCGGGEPAILRFWILQKKCICGRLDLPPLPPSQLPVPTRRPFFNTRIFRIQVGLHICILAYAPETPCNASTSGLQVTLV